MTEPSGYEVWRAALSPQARQRIDDLIASAPPPTEEQARRLRELLPPPTRKTAD